jgi:hypothetical protein
LPTETVGLQKTVGAEMDLEPEIPEPEIVEPVPKPFKRDRDHIDRFEIVSRFLLAMAASIVALMSFMFQRVDQRRAVDDRNRSTVEDIRAKNASAEAGQRAYAVQAAAALVPLVIRGTQPEREKALEAMKQIAPRLAADLTAVLQEKAASEAERDFARKINSEASEREMAEEFFGYIKVARQFLARGIYQNACIEYMQAWNRLPEAFGPQVDDQKIAAAEGDCAGSVGNDYSKGAAKFQEAFRKIQTQ